jgi:hypothetical protein
VDCNLQSLLNTTSAFRASQDQIRRQIRALIESALPARDGDSILTKSTYFSAQSRLEEGRETLRLAEEKLQNALPEGSEEHRSIALDILGEYFEPELLAGLASGQNEQKSPAPTTADHGLARKAVLVLGKLLAPNIEKSMISRCTQIVAESEHSHPCSYYENYSR